MRKTLGFRPNGLALWAGILMACSAPSLLAQEDYVIDNFDNADEASAWSSWWGSAEQIYEFDAATDAEANSNSGALKATIGFDLATYAGDNQFAARRDFPDSAVLDGTKYTNLVFDIHVDPSSPLNTSGDFGTLEFGVRDTSWATIQLGSKTLTTSATNGWTHISASIDPTAKNIDLMAGIFLKIWSGGDGGLTGTTTFWVDNVKLIANTNVAVVPPTMAMKSKLISGLQIAASASGQQYQRQSISTLATDLDGNANAYSWYGSSQPVAYSMTIKKCPETNYNGFQVHLFIIPDGTMPYGSKDTSIDWNTPHLIFLQISINEVGEYIGRLMYKTNQPSGNSMLWNENPTNGAVGTLAYLTNSTAVGTWNITFKNNTDIAFTSPSGAITNCAIPAEAAALFADPVTVYYGVQPNQTANIGLSALFSRAQISGAGTSLDDNFTEDALKANLWQIVAADASGISVVPPNAAYLLTWAAPALGFTVEASSTLTAGSWYDPGLTNIVQVGTTKQVLVTTDSLTNANTFYRLIKPASGQ